MCVTVFEACVCARVHVESFVQRCWRAVRGRAVNAVTLLQASRREEGVEGSFLLFEVLKVTR